jgi:malate dehydrogenase
MKVVIFGGGGGVGASTSFNLLLQGGDDDVVLVDCRPEMVESHVLDLEQVLELGGLSRVRGGALEDVVDADVVVVAASAPLEVNTSRLEHLSANTAIVDEVVGALGADGRWPGIVVVVTNPVDPICTWVRRRSGVERARVLGYTLNDSLRLRTGIARALQLDPGAVEAWVLGEHGDASVPLFDRVRVAGEPVALSESTCAEAEEFMRTWYVRHVALDSGRSSTWTSGVGIARMVRAIATDSGELWPASVVLEGEYGIDGAAVTVPVTLSRAGAAIQTWMLTREQREALARSADVVHRAMERLDAVAAAGTS